MLIRTAAVVAISACGPVVSQPVADTSGGNGSTTSPAPSATTGDTLGSSSTSAPGTTALPSTGSDGSTTSTTSTTSTSTGDEPYEKPTGPGCGVVPICDRGSYSGFMYVESADDIERIAGYTAVLGELRVKESSDLVCLDFLACLETIEDGLVIDDNAALQDTSGLSGLLSIGTVVPASITVRHNLSLRRLDGPPHLQQVRQSIWIYENDALESIRGFDELVYAGSLFVHDNPALEDVAGLEEIAGIEHACTVTANPSLCVSDAAEVCNDLELVPPTIDISANADC